MINRFAAAALIAAIAATPAFAAPAHPESAASKASAESAEGVAALAEAGIKVVVGVVALPVAVAGLGSVAVGSTAVEGASDAVDFATSPLSVTDDVIVKAQAAPVVPYAAQRKPAR